MTILDDTARSEAPVDEQRELAENLRAALAARDEFIAVMGHELRNAIAPLAMLAEQLALSAPAVERRKQPRPDLLTRYLRNLVAAVDRISEVAALRDGKLVVRPERVELGGVVAQLVTDLQREAAAGGVEFRVSVDQDVLGWCDRSRTVQVVAALLQNAIKHSGGGPVDIVVAASGEHAVELVVEDHGRGIADSEREHLFDPFNRKKPRRSGLGVGLWVAKSLCTAMHGSIALTPSVGGGARFCVRLPRA